MPDRTILFAVPQSHLEDFEDLLQAYCERGIGVEVETYATTLPDMGRLASQHTHLDAVLLAGSARNAPRTVLPGPMVFNGAGQSIPAAWLPVKTPETNRRFAAAAARVHRRARQTTSVALLGQWHPRYLRLADRMETLLECPLETFRWTGEVIGRQEVVEALGSGLGLGLYLGHGRPIGWVGYYGMRARHFEDFSGEPLGGLLSLCCRTASRRRTGLSYAEALPLMGVAAASFGAVTETLHTDNTRWAIRICEVLAAGVESFGELIVRAAPPNPSALAPYRLIGDPLAPLAAEAVGARRADAIQTYP